MFGQYQQWHLHIIPRRQLEPAIIGRPELPVELNRPQEGFRLHAGQVGRGERFAG
jgi:hypothetical protein